MLTTNKQQLEALASRWEASLRVSFALRLSQELPAQVGKIPEQELRRQLEEGCKVADVLGLTDSEHIYRFLRLRYLPSSTWEQPAAQELLLRVLADTSMDADRRLRFLETNLAAERP